MKTKILIWKLLIVEVISRGNWGFQMSLTFFQVIFIFKAKTTKKKCEVHFKDIVS